MGTSAPPTAEISVVRYHGSMQYTPALSSPLSLDPLLAAVLEDPDGVGLAHIDAAGRVRGANAAFTACVLGEEGTPRDVEGRLLAEFLADPRALERLRGAAGSDPGAAVAVNVVSPTRGSAASLRLWVVREGSGVRIACVPAERASRAHSTALLEHNTELDRAARENAKLIAELAAAKEELRRTLAELEGSFWQLRRIEEVLPICMRCGQVKRGDGSWADLVSFMREHANFLSHGYCPTCADAVLLEYGLRDGE